jgi:RimJ/RimL family protein N-acetyltransferase
MHDRATTADGAQPLLRGRVVTLTPTTPNHLAPLRRMRETEEVRRWWGEPRYAEGWPFDDPAAVLFTVLYEGSVRGMIQYSEETDPDYRQASIDLFLDPEVHNRGIGRDAVRTLALHLVRNRGHHRLTIDPAAANQAAIRCYASVGFRPVGVMRRYERDADRGGWHDGLLMDLLAEELLRDTP